MIFLHGGFLCPVEIAMAAATVGGLSGTYWWVRCHSAALWQRIKRNKGAKTCPKQQQ